MIYSIANLNDVSWGTRQAAKGSSEVKVQKTFFQRLCGKSDDEVLKEQEEAAGSGDINCTCSLCCNPIQIKLSDSFTKKIVQMVKDSSDSTEAEPVTNQPNKTDSFKRVSRNIVAMNKMVRRQSKFFKGKFVSKLVLNASGHFADEKYCPDLRLHIPIEHVQKNRI